MSMHACKKHGLMSPVQCDNFLDSGLRFPNSLCGDCWDYCNKMDVSRPSAYTLFCYNGVNSITSRIQNTTNELYVDLTLNESDSGDSHFDDNDDKKISADIITSSHTPCRRLFNTPTSGVEFQNEMDDSEELINDNSNNPSSYDSGTSSSDSEVVGIVKNPYNAVTALVPNSDHNNAEMPIYSPNWYLTALGVEKDPEIKNNSL